MSRDAHPPRRPNGLGGWPASARSAIGRNSLQPVGSAAGLGLSAGSGRSRPCTAAWSVRAQRAPTCCRGSSCGHLRFARSARLVGLGTRLGQFVPRPQAHRPIVDGDRRTGPRLVSCRVPGHAESVTENFFDRFSPTIARWLTSSRPRQRSTPSEGTSPGAHSVPSATHAAPTSRLG